MHGQCALIRDLRTPRRRATRGRRRLLAPRQEGPARPVRWLRRILAAANPDTGRAPRLSPHRELGLVRWKKPFGSLPIATGEQSVPEGVLGMCGHVRRAGGVVVPEVQVDRHHESRPRRRPQRRGSRSSGVTVASAHSGAGSSLDVHHMRRSTPLPPNRSTGRSSCDKRQGQVRIRRSPTWARRAPVHRNSARWCRRSRTASSFEREGGGDRIIRGLSRGVELEVRRDLGRTRAATAVSDCGIGREVVGATVAWAGDGPSSDATASTRVAVIARMSVERCGAEQHPALRVTVRAPLRWALRSSRGRHCGRTMPHRRGEQFTVVTDQA